MSNLQQDYESIRTGTPGFFRQKRGLFAVWGREAVQFLNGLITNNIGALEEGAALRAAFPNAQGRLQALVRAARRGDRFLFETEETTREKLFQNLFRFTFAGDFFVEDQSDAFEFFTIYNASEEIIPAGALVFREATQTDVFVPQEAAAQFRENLQSAGAIEISDALFEILRVESGLPRFGVDMDETTIVPELGVPDLISYNKGCYIGQEIIARIHFRGHVAKQLTGLVLSEPPALEGELKDTDLRGTELRSKDGKNAGRITSAVFSPKLQQTIALAFVRYDYLAEGTELAAGDFSVTVRNLPFVG